MREFIDLAYAALADDDGYARRAALDKALMATLPDRDTWGTDPAAVEAQRAMMALAPRPATRRPKPPPAEAP